MAGTHDQGIIKRRLLGAFQDSQGGDPDLGLTPSDDASASYSDGGGAPSVTGSQPSFSKVDFGLLLNVNPGAWQDSQIPSPDLNLTPSDDASSGYIDGGGTPGIVGGFPVFSVIDFGLIENLNIGAWQNRSDGISDLILTPSDDASISFIDSGGTPTIDEWDEATEIAPIFSRVDIGLLETVEIGAFQDPWREGGGFLNTRMTFQHQAGTMWRTLLHTHVPRRAKAWRWYFRLSEVANYGIALPGVTVGTISCEICKDGAGSFSSLSGTPTEVGAGWYYLDIAAAQMDWVQAVLKTVDSGGLAAQCDLLYFTE